MAAPTILVATWQDAVYVGTEDAHLLRLSGDGQLGNLEGFDTIAGRDTWYAGSAVVNGQPVGPPLEVRSMAITSDAGVLFANVHVGGIPRSTDGGATWQPTIDVSNDVHEVRAHPVRAGVVVAAAAVGLYISRDGGATWSVERDGLHAAHCSAVAVLGDTVFVAASEDPFAPRGAVYRRPLDSPSPCRPVGEGLPRWTDGIVDTGCIAANGSALAIADRSGNIYVRQAAGGTWSRCARRLAAPSGLLVV